MITVAYNNYTVYNRPSCVNFRCHGDWNFNPGDVRVAKLAIKPKDLVTKRPLMKALSWRVGVVFYEVLNQPVS